MAVISSANERTEPSSLRLSPNRRVWRTNQASVQGHFSLAALSWELPPSLPNLLAESALSDRSACPYDLREEALREHSHEPEGGRGEGQAHLFADSLLLPRGSILMIQMQTLDDG